MITGIHLANNNPQLQNLNGRSCLFSLLGPHAFISTKYYTVKPAVPTWNYVSLKVKGHCEVLPAQEAEESVKKALKRFQPGLLTDKETLPDTIFAKILGAITAARIHIKHIEGKEKLGQHRCLQDKIRVLQSLKEEGETEFSDFVTLWTGVSLPH